MRTTLDSSSRAMYLARSSSGSFSIAIACSNTRSRGASSGLIESSISLEEMPRSSSTSLMSVSSTSNGRCLLKSKSVRWSRRIESRVSHRSVVSSLKGLLMPSSSCDLIALSRTRDSNSLGVIIRRFEKLLPHPDPNSGGKDGVLREGEGGIEQFVGGVG